MRAVSGNTDTISRDLLDAALDSASALKTRVSLTFEGVRLPNMDKESGTKSHPFLRLFQVINGRK